MVFVANKGKTRVVSFGTLLFLGLLYIGVYTTPLLAILRHEIYLRQVRQPKLFLEIPKKSLSHF